MAGFLLLEGCPLEGMESFFETMLPGTFDEYPGGIVLPLDKPLRWTSADVVRKVKFTLQKHFRNKKLKVGHAGTLDPLATGLLIVCAGPATRQAETLQAAEKEYIADLSFGATTASFDLEQPVDRFYPFEHITREAVETALRSFVGAQEQVPPHFSAKVVGGIRAGPLRGSGRTSPEPHRDLRSAAAGLPQRFAGGGAPPRRPRSFARRTQHPQLPYGGDGGGRRPAVGPHPHPLFEGDLYPFAGPRSGSRRRFRRLPYLPAPHRFRLDKAPAGRNGKSGNMKLFSEFCV